MTKRIDDCQHRDFYHWRDKGHHGRHDHMCTAYPIRLSYYPQEDRWEVADMQASLRETPYMFTDDEAERAYRALATVMDRKRLSAPFVTPQAKDDPHKNDRSRYRPRYRTG